MHQHRRPGPHACRNPRRRTRRIVQRVRVLKLDHDIRVIVPEAVDRRAGIEDDGGAGDGGAREGRGVGHVLDSGGGGGGGGFVEEDAVDGDVGLGVFVPAGVFCGGGCVSMGCGRYVGLTEDRL